MTKRQRYLAALRNEAVDALVWAPNFDYWLAVNRAEGTVPKQYDGLSRNDIVRAIGATLWNRSGGLRTVRDASVVESWSQCDDTSVHEFQTPVGTIREVYLPTEGAYRSRFLAEHFAKGPDDLRVLTYIAEATRYEPDFEPVHQALAETGDDGVVLTGIFLVPFLQFAKTDAGYATAFYLLQDHPRDVERLLEAYTESFVAGIRVAAQGPADILHTGDNMDGRTLSPRLFRRYAVPFYQAAAPIIHEAGKLFEGHWCGQTQALLPLVPGCGLDVVEAIVTAPMADVSLSEALAMLDGKVVLQGGIPSVLVCEEGGTRDDFLRYMDEVILPLRGCRGFILGMSDNVPPNADFWRVEQVACQLKV
ncbi:MAG: hypothetical protein NT029_17205 [Armatimonadetes bacterium]|nr:hypothetical protein [Armatimonadota bacterium]